MEHKKEQEKKSQPPEAKAMEQKKPAVQEAESKELIDILQRLQAEFENYKKRAEKEKQSCIFLGKAKAVSGLLPVLDSLDAAIAKIKKEQKKEDGIELLQKQLLQAMQSLGLREVKALGERFSHDTMDCMIQGSDASKPEGTVLEELQKGYLLDGIVLRHAKVKVNKPAEKGEKKESCEEKKDEKKSAERQIDI